MDRPMTSGVIFYYYQENAFYAFDMLTKSILP